LTADSRRDMAARWWDLFARYAVLLDATGRAAQDIADSMGRPVGEVQLLLDPRAPVRFDTELYGLEVFGTDAPDLGFMAGYADTVIEGIAGSLAHVYRSAADAAAQGEQFEDVAGEMTALARYHQRRAARYGARSLWRLLPGSRDSNRAAWWCCAWSDQRAALG